jgi:hypothetical protein
MRIRSIKPELWSSPGLPSDPWARLLFIAMWNWADDNGVGSANERELLGFAFPNDPQITIEHLRRMLVEIRRVFDVDFYTVAGRPYFAIPSWEKHQKFDRRSKGKYPPPGMAETHLYLQEQSNSTESHESPPSARRDSVAGTGEQRNRGTGEEEQEPSSAQPMDTPQPSFLFNQFWDHYPRKVGRQDAQRAWDKARRKVNPAVIQAAVEQMATDPNLPETQFIPHPSTWLNRGGWDDPPYPPPSNGRPKTSTTDDRVSQGLSMAQRYAEQEAREEQQRLEIAQ